MNLKKFLKSHIVIKNTCVCVLVENNLSLTLLRLDILANLLHYIRKTLVSFQNTPKKFY